MDSIKSPTGAKIATASATATACHRAMPRQIMHKNSTVTKQPTNPQTAPSKDFFGLTLQNGVLPKARPKKYAKVSLAQVPKSTIHRQISPYSNTRKPKSICGPPSKERNKIMCANKRTEGAKGT